MKQIINKVHHILAEMLPSKSPIKKILKSIYWSLPRSWRTSNITPYALEALSGLPHKRFIQIGANNGIDHDPLYPFLIKSKWHGLMVEPNTKMMEVLRTNHQHTVSDLTFINTAIGEGVPPILYVIDFNSGIASFSKEHVMKHVGEDNLDKIKSINVNLMTFSELINKNPDFKKSDLLLIDVEGWDAKIILSIDFNEFDIDLIIFESVHISEEELANAKVYLKEHGFSSFHCRFDLVAIFNKTKNEALSKVLKNADKL